MASPPPGGYSGWWKDMHSFLTKFRQPWVKPKAPRVRRPTTRRPAPVMEPTPPAPVSRPQVPEDIAAIITDAAIRSVLLRMQYNGILRFVEPYSYRLKSTGILFFAYCYKDHGIESFRPEKIQYIEATDIPFKARWEIEIGKQT